jgi:DNA invertase Pin-like site-specific DNA recombinase
VFRRAYAGEHGHADVISYRDSGAAGNTLDRPAMNRLMADIKAGKIGAVLAVNLSRIARTIPMMLEWRRLTRENGVTFLTLAEDMQNTTPETRERLNYKSN